jgi:hypothetical protein
LESEFKERNIDPSLFQGVKAGVLQAKPNIAFENIKISSVNALKNQFSSDTFKDFQQTVNRLFVRPISDLGNEIFGPALGSVQSGDVGDKYIFGKDVLGSIFESATQFYIKGANNLPSFQDGEATRNQRFDFPMGNAEEAERLNSLFFKRGGVGIAEAKLTANASTLNSVVSKGLNNEQVIGQMKQQIASGGKASAAGGFVPNFVGSSRKMGAGEYGSFYRLNATTGTKRFLKETRRDKIPIETSDIVEEYANASLLANVPLVSGVNGPKVKNSLEDAIRARRIRKEIINWPMASTAIGGKADMVGDLIEQSFYRKGLSAYDIHGDNFAINKFGTDLINEGGRIPTYLQSGGDAWMSDFTNYGGKASIVDAGLMNPVSEDLKKYINDITSQASRILGVDSTAKKQQSFKIRSTTKTAAGGFVPNFAYEDDNIPYYVREDMEKSQSFKRIKSLYNKFPNMSYLSRGAESFTFKKDGDVLKVPTFTYGGGGRIKEKIKAIKGMNWMAASNQLSSLAPNLEIFPPKTSGAIISQSFAGETVGNVIRDYKKANDIGSKTSQIFSRAQINNPKKPNWLHPLYVDAGSAHNFTFPENLSEVKKAYFNDPSTSVDEIFNKNKIGLIDLGVHKYYVDQLKQEEKTTNAAGGFLPNFAKNKLTTESGSSLSYYDDAKGFNNIKMLKSNKKGDGFNLFNQLVQIGRAHV